MGIRKLFLVAAATLGAPLAIGMAADTSGVSERPPLPAIVEYVSLIEDVQTAFANRDGTLLRETVWTPYGDPEVWLGSWGGCGSGVRVVPIDDANLDAILEGAPIEVNSIVRRDTCSSQSGGVDAVYGLVTSGWEGKILPHTYGGKGGPPIEYIDWTSTEDTALLVFWQEARKDAAPSITEPALIGIGPADSLEVMASLPVRLGDAQCDGVTDSIDAALALQLNALLIDSLPCELQANVNTDHRVDALDALLVLQHASGLLPAFGPR